MTSSDVPTDVVRIWESAVEALKKVERRLDHEPLTPDLKRELLDALTAADDAWEEHIMRVRAWVGT